MDGKFPGTGIIATEGGVIVTCYHVLKINDGQRVRPTVGIYFPSNEHYDATANSLEEYSDSRCDIAFLQLSENNILSR